MADKRQFSMQIIDSDDFLEMPLSVQALYLHLSMRADDDGFVPNASRIMKLVNANKNDYDLLVAKAYVIEFDDGICVIRHWRINNYLRSDRYRETKFQKQKEMLRLGDDGGYVVGDAGREIPDKSAQVKKYDWIVDSWNELEPYGIAPIRRFSETGTRGTRIKNVRARLKEYGEDGFKEAIGNIHYSDFLKGRNGKGWTITFDWFIKPSNFQKVIEGNYGKKPAEKKKEVEEEKKPIDYWEMWSNIE